MSQRRGPQSPAGTKGGSRQRHQKEEGNETSAQASVRGESRQQRTAKEKCHGGGGTFGGDAQGGGRRKQSSLPRAPETSGKKKSGADTKACERKLKQEQSPARPVFGDKAGAGAPASVADNTERKNSAKPKSRGEALGGARPKKLDHSLSTPGPQTPANTADIMDRQKRAEPKSRGEALGGARPKKLEKSLSTPAPETFSNTADMMDRQKRAKPKSRGQGNIGKDALGGARLKKELDDSLSTPAPETRRDEARANTADMMYRQKRAKPKEGDEKNIGVDTPGRCRGHEQNVPSSQPPRRSRVNTAALEEKAKNLMKELNIQAAAHPTREASAFFEEEVKVKQKEKNDVAYAFNGFRTRIIDRLEESTPWKWDHFNSGSTYDGTKVCIAF